MPCHHVMVVMSSYVLLRLNNVMSSCDDMSSSDDTASFAHIPSRDGNKICLLGHCSENTQERQPQSAHGRNTVIRPHPPDEKRRECLRPNPPNNTAPKQSTPTYPLEEVRVFFTCAMTWPRSTNDPHGGSHLVGRVCGCVGVNVNICAN